MGETMISAAPMGLLWAQLPQPKPRNPETPNSRAASSERSATNTRVYRQTLTKQPDQVTISRQVTDTN